MNEDLIRELKKLALAANRADKERADALATLIVHPSWSIYAELVNAMAQTKGESLLRSIRPDEVLGQEYDKGTVNGLLAAIALPSVIITAMRTVSTEGDD